MRPFYILLLVVLACGQYACVPTPKDTAKALVDAQHNAGEKTRVDTSIKIPPPKGYTSDFVNLFSEKEIQSLDSLIGNYEKKTSVQIAVATVNASMVGDMEIEAYSLQMLRTWGVGQKGKNNGILIVIAPDIRKVRIENGYGIEKVISDEETKEIIEKVIVPRYKEGKYYEGTKAAILAMMKKLEGISW